MGSWRVVKKRHSARSAIYVAAAGLTVGAIKE